MEKKLVEEISEGVEEGLKKLELETIDNLVESIQTIK